MLAQLPPRVEPVLEYFREWPTFLLDGYHSNVKLKISTSDVCRRELHRQICSNPSYSDFYRYEKIGSGRKLRVWDIIIQSVNEWVNQVCEMERNY